MQYIFQEKKYNFQKTRVFPYIAWGCELFSTTLFIFFTTATWPKQSVFICYLGSLKPFNFGLFLPWLPPASLGFYSKSYLKSYLKIYLNISIIFSPCVFTFIEERILLFFKSSNVLGFNLINCSNSSFVKI